MFKRVKDWLERLGDENERLYGNRRLECCGINHHRHQSRPVQRLRQESRPNQLNPQKS